MIDLCGLHRADDTYFVGYRLCVRLDVCNVLTLLSYLRELELRSQAPQFLILQLRDGLALRHRLRHWLSVHFCQSRLVIKSFQVRRTASHIEENDSFDSRSVVRQILIALDPVTLLAHWRPGKQRSVQQCGHRCRAQPQRRLAEKRSTLEKQLLFLFQVHGGL